MGRASAERAGAARLRLAGAWACRLAGGFSVGRCCVRKGGRMYAKSEKVAAVAGDRREAEEGKASS